MYNCVKEYSNIRGFNFQPDWGGHGITIWLNFNEKRYRELLENGKEKFPKMNTVRIWLSFDAWYENRKLYLENLKKAGEIITSLGLNIIPVYFNGWFSLPVFGGFTPESINSPEKIVVYGVYLRECVEMLKPANILIHDLSNEPLNNTSGNVGTIDKVFSFLSEMSTQLRKIDNRPITVGTQSYIHYEEFCDVDIFDPIVDVFTMHPYNIKCDSKEVFMEDTVKILEYIEKFDKPVIITECCWAGKTDEDRIPYLETELNTFSELKIGFCCHAMSTSPVADLYPLEGDMMPSKGLYMAFLDKNGEIRKGHDIFNRV